MNIEPKTDSDAAVAFLKRWPTRYPVLSASWINAQTRKKEKFETASFAPNAAGDVDWDKVREWIDTRQRRANIYFSVNAVITRKNERGMELKAERTDLQQMVALHVDVDPRVEESQEDARARIIKALDAYDPKPSVIISSGGGAQGFWLLDPAEAIDGDLARAEDLKRYNIHLERELGGDACHNVDRIMRLPGTVNVPDVKKVQKGRKPALAELVRYDDALKYPLSRFLAAPNVAAEPQNKGSAPHVVSDQLGMGKVVEVFLDDDPRFERVSDRTRAMILHGFATGDYADNELPKDGSIPLARRSQDLFYVVCDLVRSEVPDDAIYAVITDPFFAISTTVLEKGKEMRRYALRQIKRAHEMAFDPDLVAMNDEFAVVCMEGKTRVLSWKPSNLTPGAMEPVFSTFEEFKNRLMNRRHRWGEKSETKEAPMGHWWLGQEARAQYDYGIVFAPGADAPPGKLNLWNGWAVSAKEGNCGLYLKHVKDNICSGNDDHYAYLIRWMARAVQRPNEVGEVAVVLRGREGVGKGVFASQFGALYGIHFLQVFQTSHLVGKFNAHLLRICLLYADEAFFAGDKAHESVLKGIVSEGRLMMEKKGIDSFQVRNIVHLIMSSNNDWVIPASADARRYFVLDVGAEHMQDTAYFEEIRRQMENGGREALLDHLLRIDLSDFNVRAVPKTEALAAQKAHTRKGIDAVIEELCRTGRMPCAVSKVQADRAITSGRAQGRGFNHWIDENFPDLKRAYPQTICNGLNKWGVKTGEHSGDDAFVVFPELKELRAEFATRYSAPANGWDRPNGEWIAEVEQKFARGPAPGRDVDERIPF